MAQNIKFKSNIYNSKFPQIAPLKYILNSKTPFKYLLNSLIYPNKYFIYMKKLGTLQINLDKLLMIQ